MPKTIFKGGYRIMALFAESNIDPTNNNMQSLSEMFSDLDAVMEAFIVGEVSQLPQEKINEFCAPGGVGEQLVQEGKLRRNTLVRLNKQDDFTRRKHMNALQLAKEANDPLWAKLAKNRVNERKLLNAIYKKYDSKSNTVTRKQQNEWLHGSKPILPKSFQKAGGEDRI